MRAPDSHRAHLGAEHVHAKHVRLLPLDIDGAHEHDAFEPEAGAGGRGRDAMLAGAGFGDDALLAHAAGEQNLAEHVVDLVRAGVIELVALEIDFGAAIPARGGGHPTHMLGHALGIIKRARAADIMRVQARQFGMKCRIVTRLVIGALEIEDQRHQGFRDETAAELAEMAVLVGAGAEGIGIVDLDHARLRERAF